MDKKDLLKFCRYYKGEDDCPFKEQNKSMLWFYERAWIFDMLKDSDNLSSCISEYIRCGLGLFEQFDNADFDKQTAISIAQSLNIPQKTAERYLKQWYLSGQMNRVKHGWYSKV